MFLFVVVAVIIFVTNKSLYLCLNFFMHILFYILCEYSLCLCLNFFIHILFYILCVSSDLSSPEAITKFPSGRPSARWAEDYFYVAPPARQVLHTREKNRSRLSRPRGFCRLYLYFENPRKSEDIHCRFIPDRLAREQLTMVQLR